MVHIQKELDEKLKGLKDILNLSKGLYAQMRGNAFKLINHNSDEDEYPCITKTHSEQVYLRLIFYLYFTIMEPIFYINILL